MPSQEPSGEPTDDLPFDLPEQAVPHDRKKAQPLGSPYAIPLGTLVAGAYVGVTDQVQTQPVHDGPYVGVNTTIVGDDGN